MAEPKRTPGGSPTADSYEKYGNDQGRFPIFDKKSALAALKLRGHAKTARERADIIRRAMKFAPEEAKLARQDDLNR